MLLQRCSQPFRKRPRLMLSRLNACATSPTASFSWCAACLAHAPMESDARIHYVRTPRAPNSRACLGPCVRGQGLAMAPLSPGPMLVALVALVALGLQQGDSRNLWLVARSPRRMLLARSLRPMLLHRGLHANMQRWAQRYAATPWLRPLVLRHPFPVGVFASGALPWRSCRP
jgi:hypothetical protein